MQLKMFEGVKGNTLGEPIPSSENIRQYPGTPSVPDLGETSDLDNHLIELDIEPAALSPVQIDVFPVVEDCGESLPIEELSPPPAPPIQIASQSPVSSSNPNPYDPASNASVWARIRAFFLDDYKE